MIGVGGTSGACGCFVVCEPAIARAVGTFPTKTCVARFGSEEVTFFEADGASKGEDTFADEEGVIGSTKDLERDGGGVSDTTQASNGTGFVQWAEHYDGVELDDAKLIGKADQADGKLFGIIFDDLHALDDGVEKMHSGKGEGDGVRSGEATIPGGDKDWKRREIWRRVCR